MPCDVRDETVGKASGNGQPNPSNHEDREAILEFDLAFGLKVTNTITGAKHSYGKTEQAF